MAKQIESYVEENLTDGAQQTALEFIKELVENNLCRGRRINLHTQGGGMRRTGVRRLTTT